MNIFLSAILFLDQTFQACLIPPLWHLCSDSFYVCFLIDVPIYLIKSESYCFFFKSHDDLVTYSYSKRDDNFYDLFNFCSQILDILSSRNDSVPHLPCDWGLIAVELDSGCQAFLYELQDIDEEIIVWRSKLISNHLNTSCFENLKSKWFQLFMKISSTSSKRVKKKKIQTTSCITADSSCSFRLQC